MLGDLVFIYDFCDAHYLLSSCGLRVVCCVSPPASLETQSTQRVSFSFLFIWEKSIEQKNSCLRQAVNLLCNILSASANRSKVTQSFTL